MTRLSMLTAVRLLRVLQQLGFRVDRQRGSHMYLSHPDGRRTVVPMHRGEDIGRGLLRKILRDIQVEPEAFTKLL